MEQITFIEPRHVEAREAPDPSLQGDGEALVRPVAVATCDLDLAIVRGNTPFEGPFPLGHECVAEVLEVGDSVESVRQGDLVSVPFQVSCGGCDRCRAGHTAHCTGHGGSIASPSQFYGLAPTASEWGGFLSDMVRVPFADHMLVHLPDGVAPATAASVSDNLADAWRCVAGPLERLPGAEVLVVGGTDSIGIYAVAIAAALGAGRVDYVDPDPSRRERAEGLGATIVGEEYPERGGSYPITVDASAHPDGLRCAIRSTDIRGICTSVGIYYQPVELPVMECFLRSITFFTGITDARPAMEPLLELIASGRLQPDGAVARNVQWDQAVDALEEAEGKLVISR